MQRKKYYQFILIGLLALDIIVSVLYYIWYLDKKIPASINIVENTEESFDFNLPVQCNSISNDDIKVFNNSNKGGSLKVIAGKSSGSCKAELKLFGLIHYRDIKFNVIKKQKVMPSGKAAGIYVNARGVMVLGTSAIQGKGGNSYNPAKNILQAGDYIYMVDGKEVSSIDDIENILQVIGAGNIKMKVRRGREKIDVKIKGIEGEDGKIKIGTWLREDTEGIGTITYIAKNNTYAALGHGIADADTGLLIDISAGGLYEAVVNRIIPSKKGVPGQISGSVELSDRCRIGSIIVNNDSGIKGEMDKGKEGFSFEEKSALPVALKQDITEGKAFIMCQLGENIEKYEVEICNIFQNSKENKDMIIKVTDKKLLEKTGGIVQGMSGSPIVQGGKIVGAVTHVFVDNPARGYAIFIEKMFK
ncbi:SpoIVB peptidase [Eubacterium sp. MSJ-13]|uniref:SpoIVB peptidase n=1 Tax=Eubacterium sp. MSJ-13 TaxID=2841513 RepID=UPI001C0F9969|nr:SpoIVB peptidase [Eubacterium sp. MSJ-13]MBU5478710.1 SpoIVB peptidase [Eubacterium sp. MSJ-13]